MAERLPHSTSDEVTGGVRGGWAERAPALLDLPVLDGGDQRATSAVRA